MKWLGMHTPTSLKIDSFANLLLYWVLARRITSFRRRHVFWHIMAKLKNESVLKNNKPSSQAFPPIACHLFSGYCCRACLPDNDSLKLR